MTRLDCLRIILRSFATNPIIFTTGYTCREAYAIEDRKNHFYMVGSMGLVSSIATGLAHFIKDKVVIVDGDGSLLMNPAGLFLPKILETKNIIHILLDNNAYDSTGGQISQSYKIDFKRIAYLTGYKQVKLVENKVDLQLFLNIIAKSNKGPSFLQVTIISNGITSAPRVKITLADLAARFKTYLASN